MAKRVFFSFHYKDVIDFRANVVRMHWVLKDDREEAGYFDASIWEEAKKQNEIGLKRLINGALENTSATCVLVGSDTYARPWVRYEIIQSIYRGNRVFGVHINQIKGKDQLVVSEEFVFQPTDTNRLSSEDCLRLVSAANMEAQKSAIHRSSHLRL